MKEPRYGLEILPSVSSRISIRSALLAKDDGYRLVI